MGKAQKVKDAVWTPWLAVARGPGTPTRRQHTPRAQLVAAPHPASACVLRHSRGIFEFQHPSDYPVGIALATELLDGRHWISSPHSLRLQRSVHHPVRDTLAWLLTAVLGPSARGMVIREDRDGGGRMSSLC